MSLGPKSILIAQWVLVAVATIVIGARVNLRVRIQRRRLLTSDILMCLALASSIAAACPILKLVDMGILDPHISPVLWNLDGSPDEIELALKLMFASQFAFLSTFYICKAALLAVYVQIFPPFMKKRRIFLWVTVGFVVVAYIVSLLAFLLACSPPSRAWETNFMKRCRPEIYLLVFEVSWALHFSGDVCIFILPWLVLIEMNLRTSLKIGIYLTFMLGIVNIAVCLVRLIVVKLGDLDLPTLFFWTSLDVYLGLVIACLPSLRPYFNNHNMSSNKPTLNTVETESLPMDSSFSTAEINGATISSRQETATRGLV